MDWKSSIYANHLPEDKPKRKRRSKAEMEADKAA